METIAEYIDSLDEPLKSVARSLQAVVEKSLPASHGTLVDGHPCWSNGDTAIASLESHGDHVTIALLERPDSKDYSSMGEIDPEELNLWISAEDIR
jgi:hypothetical protein